MRLVSVNVGVPREIGVYNGKKTYSAIYKSPVQGPVAVRTLNLEGDRQAAQSVHGGEDMAVYGYPTEHYPFWQGKFPKMEMPWGTFGENLSTEGLTEGMVHVGDQFSVGSALIEATRPRFPCFKLGMRFETQDMVGWFLDSGRSGFYFKVVREGTISAGDQIVFERSRPDLPTIADLVRERKKSE